MDLGRQGVDDVGEGDGGQAGAPRLVGCAHGLRQDARLGALFPLLQPIAPADVAEILARVAVGAPQGRYRDITGPASEDMVDMARRTHAAQGKNVRLVPTWHNGIFGSDMAGDVMLPGADAELAPTSFERWLATQAA